MAPGDIELAIEWAAREGWNPGMSDGDCFYHTDPRGFFLGLLDGEPVGCISAVAYDGAFGFIGLYIVRPEYRGQGFGIRLWNVALEYLGDRNVGLDGVIAQQDNYKRSGFRLAYRNIRYEGVGHSSGAEGLVDLEDVPLAGLVAYDAGIFPSPRPEFLRRWVCQPDGVAIGCQTNGRLSGYGVIRACRNGFKIGPLFADDREIARRIMDALSGHAAGKPVFLDVPEVNPAAVDLAESHGMHPVFETARMYTKEPYMSQLHRVFGVTSFELG
ncbi:MAG TPA: GNAT family N-acetyltransferase [Methanocella sp.]|jgi:ribosomal protein S18 acetylase RimI-like enzyme